MKALIGLVLALAVLGGGGYGLYRAGKLPFLHPAKSAKKAPVPAEGAEVAQSAPSATAPAPVRTSPTPVARTPQKDPEAEARAERRLARLAALYEGMSAEDAKPIVDRLPDALVEDLLRRMDEQKAARLLLGMKPERAAKMTAALAREPAATAVASR